MSAVSTSNRFSDSGFSVAGEQVDSLTEAVVVPQGALARGARICNLVNEMCAAVEWLHSSTLSDAAGIELSSLRQLAAAAHDHQLRMRISFGTDGATNEVRT
jgi:hypothetical protein